jgi:putative ABC transport system ATP-binding protein
MSLTDPLLATRNLGRRRPGAEGWLLQDVSLELRAGQRLVLVGPTGAGKSVLLKAIALLDPVDDGQILWRGRPILADEVPAYRSQVVYLHQQPALFEGTVEANLRLPFHFKIHRRRRFDRPRAEELMARFERRPDFLTKATRDLSGGEGQITAVVRALLIDPEILLLDEPTAALDPETTERVEAVVGQWVAEGSERRAVIWVSHDRPQAERVADRRLELRAGRLTGGSGQ